MFLTDGYNIKIPRGDSADIKFTFISDDGEAPYILPAGKFALIEVFPVKGAAPVITKRIERSAQSSDGSVIVHFAPSDTDIPCAVWLYTVKIKSADGSVCDTMLGFNEEAYFAVSSDHPKRTEQNNPDGVIVTVSSAEGALPAYTGSYTVEPSFSDDVTLNTAGCSMTDNVTVLGIPVTETENAAGGTTVSIG